MTTVVNYLHVGYPKNFSTSLQRDYFSKHPDIFHLGVGLNSNLGYLDSTVDKIFEVYLKTAKTFAYEKSRRQLVEHVHELRDVAKHKGAKAFGASSEHLSFSFAYDGLSCDIKADRALELFGNETHIIMIIRNQIDLVKSLYRESVRVGFKGGFSYYVYLLYKYQDRNYLSDLFYDWVYQVYAQRFGRENVHVFLFEDFRRNGKLVLNESGSPLLFDALNTALNLQFVQMELGHYNVALSDAVVNQMVDLNCANTHGLGNHLYESAEKHRISNYLKEDLSLYEDDETTYRDVRIKSKLIDIAKDLPCSAHLNYECDPILWERLQTNFESSNKKFERISGRVLTSEYLK